LLAGTHQGLDACNGWTFWHLETAQGLVSIDVLRARSDAEIETVVTSLGGEARGGVPHREAPES
jgi:hypothetical protein